MRRIGLWIGGVAMAGLAACAEPAGGAREFTATVTGTGETFTGRLEAGGHGSRTFTLRSARSTCSGVATGSRTAAQASFTCSDGRSGSLPVVLGRGGASGSIDGQALSVQF